MVEYREIRKRFFYDGVELASFVGRYPYLERYEHISEFYEALVHCSFEWFSGELCEALKGEYEADTDPKKRFGRSVCRYIADFVAAEEDSRLSVKCDIVLKKDKKELLSEFHEIQLWDTNEQIMMRPQKEKKRKERKEKEKKESSE